MHPLAKGSLAAVALALGLAGPAAAQTADLFPEDKPAHVRTGIGTSVTVGGAVSGFTDDDTRDFVDPGGGWEARLTLGTRTPVGFEVAYTGTLQDVQAIGLDDDALLMSHGAEALARVNILRDELQPYFVAGIGWRHYAVVNEDFNTSSFHGDDDIGEIPFGIGIAYRTGGLVLDLRGAFRAAFADDFDEELTADTSDPRFDTWSVSGKVGWEF